MTTRGQGKREIKQPDRLVKPKKSVPATTTTQSVSVVAAENKEETEYDRILAKNDNLDAYLAAEFIDDAQTQPPSILANYLKSLYGNITPQEMQKKINELDDRIKAFYLLSLARRNFKGSLGSSTQSGNTFDTLTTADYEDVSGRSGKVEKLANISDQGKGAGWPATLDSKVGFLFNVKILRSILDQIIPIVAPIFKVESDLPAVKLTGLLGSHYGLQKYPIDVKSRVVEDINQRIVAANLFRVALVQPENIQKFVFEKTDRNLEALKSILSPNFFGGTKIPEHIVRASLPFFVKVDSVLTDAEKNDVGLSKLKEKFPESFPKMSDPATTQDPAAQGATDDAAAQAAQAATDDAAAQAAQAAQAATDAANLAAQANAALAATSGSGTEPSDQRCENVKVAATAAEEKVKALAASIDKYAEQAEKASDIIRRQDTLIQTLIQLKGEKAALEGSTAALQAQLTQCMGEKTSLQARITELEARIADLEKQIAALQQQEADARKYAQDILDQIVVEEAKIDELFQLGAKIDAQFAKSEGDKAAKLKELSNRLSSRRAEMAKKIEDLKKDYQATGSNADELLKECEEKRKELADQIEKAKLLQSNLEGVNEREARLKRELQDCQSESERLARTLRTFCEEQGRFFTTLNQLVDGVSNKVTGAVDALSRLVAEQDVKVKDYDSQVNAQIQASPGAAAPSQ